MRRAQRNEAPTPMNGTGDEPEPARSRLGPNKDRVLQEPCHQFRKSEAKAPGRVSKHLPEVVGQGEQRSSEGPSEAFDCSSPGSGHQTGHRTQHEPSPAATLPLPAARPKPVFLPAYLSFSSGSR